MTVDHKNRKLIAGLFGVHYKTGRLRLIVDRRPQNATEDRLCWETLPHGSMLSQLYLEPNQHVRGSGDDLENYFYLPSHEPVWRPRNCFGRVFSGADAVALGRDGAQRYHMMLKVVAMGDLNSVDVAQATHVGLLQKAGWYLKT